MKRTALIIATILATISLGQGTFAATENLDVPKCSLGVYPYNPSAAPSYGATGNLYIELLSGFKIGAKTLADRYDVVTQAECKNRVPYGQSHLQGVSTLKGYYQNVLSAAKKLQQVPRTIHEHTYINPSLQDSRFYKSLIYSFEITLESDAFNNTKSNELQCTTPVPETFGGNANDLLDCDGYVATLYGGTKITKTNVGGKTVITWKFGVDSAGNYFYTPGNQNVGINAVPYTLGNNVGMNAGLQTIDSSADLTKPLSPYRIFRPHVTMTSKDNLTDEFWSATTTSRVFLRNYEINAPTIVRDGKTYGPNLNFNEFFYITCKGLDQPDTGWCPAKVSGGEGLSISVKDTSTGTVGSRGRLFWFDIGSVASIWQQPITPPPSDLACADLQWDGAFLKKSGIGTFVPATVNKNALLPNEEAVMKFKTIYQSGSGTKRPLEYRWVAFYPESNRPEWFKNEDSLFIILIPGLTTSLPGKLLTVAHAALPGPDISDTISPGSIPGPIQTALIQIGKFKDELSSALSGNPITDDDFQAYYSGGSEGVILGVQAFYTDGKNISGQGPMVNTPGGIRQKAINCHLELVIQPTPPTCIDLEISPDSLKPNTPVTFTVTPKFKPSDKVIPLNYQWSAEKATDIIGSGVSGKLDLSDLINSGIFEKIPGSGSSSPGGSNWWDVGVIDGLGTIDAIGGYFNPCPGGDCFQTKPFDPFNPLPPVEQFGFGVSEPVITPGLGSGLNIPGGLGAGQFGGTNIFAEFGKAAVPPIGSITPSTTLDPSLIPTVTGKIESGTGEGGYGQDPIPYSPSGSGSDTPVLNPGSLGQIGDILDSMFKFGGFKDAEATSAIPVNPFLETVDNKTWYSGGPAGTLIKVQAKGKDGTLYPLCKDSLVIPEIPDEAKCQQLKIKFFDGSTEVSKENLIAGKTYRIEVDTANSKKTDGTPITKYSIFLNNPAGPGAYGTLAQAPGNAASCKDIEGAAGTISAFETAVSCKYLFTPKANDKIRIQAVPDDGVAACKIEQNIPETPKEPICKSLNLTTSPLLPGNEFGLGQKISLTTNPRDTENNLRDPIVYTDENKGGYFVADPSNAVSCPAVPAESSVHPIVFEAPSSCKYSFQSPTNLSDVTEGKLHFSVKVKQHDGVDACLEEFELKVKPEEKEICLALNLKVNGQFTLNPLIEPGQSYALQVQPMATKGNLINMVEWTENGDGKLIGDPGNPGICPASIDNGSVVTLSVCRYIFASSSSATNIGFSVKAVPHDGVANCQAKSDKFIPPEGETPYCLYLDLDYTPEPFNPLASSQMNATVVMSDGSKYNDNVRFTSTDGAGQFSGGFGLTSGSGSSNFRTQTDSTNNTRTVNYQNGSVNSGINIMLADTSIKSSAACQRQLKPAPIKEKICTESPDIIRKTGNTYCAENGDSASYCWSLTGPGNPLFNNGSNKATGNCITLDQDYSNFKLTVEDCNPKFRDICFDTYTKESIPKIDKRISKISGSYGTKINYSTTGSTQTQTVKYKIDFTPANYQAGTSMIARIYDPAFTGKLQGYKTDADGKNKTAGGNIDFSDIESTLKINGFSNICNSSSTPIDRCYFVNKGQGLLQLQGITSPEKISIEYQGKLTSGITIEDCRSGKYCNEQFINQSFVTEMEFCVEGPLDGDGNKTFTCTPASKVPEQKCEYFYNDKGERVAVKGQEQDCKMDKLTLATNTTLAELVCQYFLTRASGDIFLEDELKYGIDVSKCYPFKNISSTITKPAEPIPGKLVKTGTPEVISISHEICSAGQSNFDTLDLTSEQKTALTKLFGADISKLSSQICEVGLVPGSDWDRENIAASINQNVGKLVRWDDGIKLPNTINGVQDIINEGRVYYYKGNGSDALNIPGLTIPEGSGALTIIVENADLIITGDIKYDSTGTATSANEISSLGVIVLDGNLKIDNNVQELAGAYFIQRSNADDYTKGNVLPQPIADTENRLTVYGSVYGNIGSLFEHRIGAGDISKDEGAITIRYDQRIIQNPPAGLAEILGQFSQGQIAQ